MKFAGIVVCLAVLGSCGSRNPTDAGASSGLSSSPAPVSYMPRIGLAVITGSRTCIAIHNANLTVGSPVTLVSPMAPQTFTQAEIDATSASACPISKDIDPTVANYDIRVPQGAGLPKLTPLIAVLGPSAPFSAGPNNNVLVDLDQNGKKESFRACSAGDGINVTVWSGTPLDSTLLWHGYYYDPGNAGVGPACTPKETAGS